MAKRAKVQEVESLELNFELAELPSSQHRAGLAGLVLMVRWLARHHTPKGICQLTRLDERGASLHIDKDGLAALFNEVYAATLAEQERPQLFKNKKNEIIPPLREEVKPVVDARTGQTKERKVYIYLDTIPRGAFLVDADPSSNGDNGVWIKLWRDMVWNILRGVPATREPFKARAEGREPEDVLAVWQELMQPLDHSVTLPSTYYIGAQANNAENVPFKDRARYQFLLHFWPFVAQIYVPAIIDNENKREFVGYALAIPDVADLKWFCEELPPILKNRDIEKTGYRPRAAVVDLAVEGALDLLSRLQNRLKHLEGARATADLVLGIDVIHIDKDGNNVKLLGAARLDPEEHMIDEYVLLRHLLKNSLFRRQRLLNLVNGDHWFSGFDRILCTVPYEQTIEDSYFRYDARVSFQSELRVKESDLEMADENLVSEPPVTELSADNSCEELIYKVVGIYISRKLKSKYGLEWSAVKDNPKAKADYEEAKEKIARDAFLAIRSRTGVDFIDYFASTLCSIPQHMSEDNYSKLAQALYQETDKVRTLTMLALSARS